MSLNDAREYHTSQTHYLRKAITYADDGTTVSLGWVPDGAVIVDGGVNVSTAFDGDTTNTLDIGYRNGGNSETDDADEFASAIALGTAGSIVADDMATAAVNTFPNGAEITASVTSTASASAGAGVVWVLYLADNS